MKFNLEVTVLVFCVSWLFATSAFCWSKYTDPSDYPGLPANVVTALKKKGCAIPQSDKIPQPNNAVNGEIIKKGQKDWAVLCYIGSRNYSAARSTC
jgi:hypothetical protein